LLRRTKSQVLDELPPKTEIVVTVPLEHRQRDLYESVRMTMEKRVRDALDARGLAKSHIVVLDALLKLRQVCCHPALVKSETARKSRAHSAKTERLVELLTELLAEGRRAIVFSQFTSMLDIVANELDRLGVVHRQITGRTRKRQPIIDAFQAGEFPVLLISLKAGGTGINLTNADTVIHYDPWWNPAVEDQATDRTHRIGQTRPVTVYRLVCEGTVEQRVLALQDRKRALTQAVQRDAEQRGADGMGLQAKDVELLLSPLGEG
jgi:SNF2 family DNA or RNA helicase